jgi:hypothetical protein
MSERMRSPGHGVSVPRIESTDKLAHPNSAWSRTRWQASERRGNPNRDGSIGATAGVAGEYPAAE